MPAHIESPGANWPGGRGVGGLGIEIASTCRLFCAPSASLSVGFRSRSFTTANGEYQWTSVSCDPLSESTDVSMAPSLTLGTLDHFHRSAPIDSETASRTPSM